MNLFYDYWFLILVILVEIGFFMVMVEWFFIS